MNTDLLKQVIDRLAAFEQQTDPRQQHLPGFTQWLNRHVPPPTATPPAAPVTESGTYGFDYLPPLPKTATFIAHYLVTDYRYHKQHVKKALEGTPLITYDDFIYLTLLAMNGPMTKMSLVDSTVNQKASGMLVIKRLLTEGFVVQTEDQADQRVRWITLTDKGRAMLAQVLPPVSQAMALLVGNLSSGEQQQLAQLLTKLDEFHKPLYIHEKDTPLSQLHEKLIGPNQ